MAFVDQLINSESSGNPNASITIADGRTFRGLGQLGEARLKEVGMGELFTLEQYENDEDLQRWALDRDIENTKAYIKNNNLGRFVGTEINGVPMTEDNMISVAHLGGRGGLNKYLTSGGSYNPSDELGTSLSDYSSKFAGGPRMAQPSKLDDFAADMKESASTTAKAAEALSKQPPRDFLSGEAGLAGLQGGPRMDHLKKLPGPMQGPQYPGPMQGPQSPGPMQGPQYPGPMQGPQYPGPMQGPANSAALPNMVRPTLGDGGMPAGAGPMQGPAYPGPMQGPNQPAGVTVSTQGPSQATAPGKTPFMQKMAEMLYPNQDNPEKKFRTTINALGVGLGQMSSGQTVDLQPFFNNIATQRQSSIDAATKARFDNAGLDVRRGNLEVAQRNADIAYDRLSYDMGKDGASLPFSKEQLSEYAGDPALAQFLPMISSPDKKTREEGVKALIGAVKEKVEAETETNPELGALYGALKAKAPIKELMNLINEANLTPTELASVITASDADKTALVKNAEEYARGNPNITLPEAMIELQRAGVGKDLEGKAADFEFDHGVELRKKYGEQSVSAQKLERPLRNMLSATDGLLSKGVKTGVLTSMLGGLQSAALSLSNYLPGGGSSSVEAAIAEFAGVPLAQIEKLSEAEKIIGFQLTRAMLENQGSVSDNERSTALKAVVNGNTTAEVRINAIGTLQASNDVDRMAYEYLVNRPDWNTNATGIEATLNINLGDISSALAEANANTLQMLRSGPDMLNNKEYYDIYTKATGGDAEAGAQYRELISPRLTPKQAEIAGRYLKKYAFWYDTKNEKYVRTQ